MFLILSTSLNTESRSRILAAAAKEKLAELGEEAKLVDMRDFPLPHCDGELAYGDPNVGELGEMIVSATGILISSPIYNYDLNSTAKNLLELTGQKWIGKTVGFLCAAGGRSSYMSVMSFANSLMLDFRCMIIPRFVYTDGSAFQGDTISDPEMDVRISELCRMLIRISGAIETED